MLWVLLAAHRRSAHHACSINPDQGIRTVVIIFAPLTLLHVMIAIYVCPLDLIPQLAS